jgi:hypothetical protein
MQGSAEILQEYLVKLGYQVDASSYLKFNENLNSTQKRLFGIGTAAAAAVAATVAATTKFAYATRKTFFESGISGTTPNSVKAFSKAAEQIGISADSAESSLQSFGSTLQNTPAMKGFFETITGRKADTDNLENYLRLVEALRKKFGDTAEGRGVAAQFAEQFGISKEQYLLMAQNFDSLAEKTRGYKNQQDALFTEQDQEKLAHYANTVDNLKNSFIFAGEAILYKFGPALDSVAAKADAQVSGLSKWAHGEIGFWDWLTTSGEEAEKRWGSKSRPLNGPNPGGSAKPGEGGDVDKFLQGVKGVESSGGNYNAKNPLSSASGAYQFIDSTWSKLTKKYGVGQEFSSAKAAPKEIQDTIAKKYASELLQQYGGDMSKAANVWYTGNPQGQMTAQGLATNRGFTSEQYQDRFNRSLGGGAGMSTSNNVTIKNDFNVTGTDAQSISKSIAMTLQRQIGDVTRNTQGLQP